MESPNDAGSKNWLKERAAISAAHRRQKTDPAAARLIEKADQLHKERTQKNLRETVEEDDEARDEFPEPAAKDEGRDRRTNVKSSFRRSVLFSSPLNHSSTPADEDELEDIDAIANVPPPEEVVVKVSKKPAVEEKIESNHGKETSEDVYRSFAEVLEKGLTEPTLELSFDLKPEDIKVLEEEEEEEDDEEEEEEEEEAEEGEEEGEEEKEEKEEEEKEEEKEEKEEEKKEEKEEKKGENQEEQADANEAHNTEEKVQKESEYTDTEINHKEEINNEINNDEEINGDVKEQALEDDKSNKKESTLTEGVEADSKNND